MIYMMVMTMNMMKRRHKMKTENKVVKAIDKETNVLYTLYIVILNSLFK